jgi:hypothetical protein
VPPRGTPAPHTMARAGFTPGLTGHDTRGNKENAFAHSPGHRTLMAHQGPLRQQIMKRKLDQQEIVNNKIDHRRVKLKQFKSTSSSPMRGGSKRERQEQLLRNLDALLVGTSSRKVRRINTPFRKKLIKSENDRNDETNPPPVQTRTSSISFQFDGSATPDAAGEEAKSRSSSPVTVHVGDMRTPQSAAPAHSSFQFRGKSARDAATESSKPPASHGAPLLVGPTTPGKLEASSVEAHSGVALATSTFHSAATTDGTVNSVPVPDFGAKTNSNLTPKFAPTFVFGSTAANTPPPGPVSAPVQMNSTAPQSAAASGVGLPVAHASKPGPVSKASSETPYFGSVSAVQQQTSMGSAMASPGIPGTNMSLNVNTSNQHQQSVSVPPPPFQAGSRTSTGNTSQATVFPVFGPSRTLSAAPNQAGADKSSATNDFAPPIFRSNGTSSVAPIHFGPNANESKTPQSLAAPVFGSKNNPEAAMPIQFRPSNNGIMPTQPVAATNGFPPPTFGSSNTLSSASAQFRSPNTGDQSTPVFGTSSTPIPANGFAPPIFGSRSTPVAAPSNFGATQPSAAFSAPNGFNAGTRSTSNRPRSTPRPRRSNNRRA